MGNEPGPFSPRDDRGNKVDWDTWVKFEIEGIEKLWQIVAKPSGNPAYRPEFVLDLARVHIKCIFRRYSRGDAIPELGQHFAGLLDAWELSNRLSDEICAQEGVKKCRDWIFALTDLNHYIWCFWLVGLALALEIPDNQWQRLLALIGSEGEDALLDRIIASREPGRKIGQKLLHSKPYSRLLKAINAPKDQQALLLKEFVDHWYAELDRPKKRGADPVYYRPFWYDYGDENFEGGSYFGRWCIEAVATVKAFGLDDSLCLGHEHYPGDLLRPDGPTTHPQRNEPKTSFWTKLFGKKSG
jgi:hypothetical protein